MKMITKLWSISDRIEELRGNIGTSSNEELIAGLIDISEDIRYLNNELIKDIESEAYRLIRRKSRDMINNASNEELGSYTRGIVDLQTELYSSLTDDH